MSPNEVMQALSVSFVHRRILGAAVGFVTGGPTAAVSGFVSARSSKTSRRTSGGGAVFGGGGGGSSRFPFRAGRTFQSTRTGEVRAVGSFPMGVPPEFIAVIASAPLGFQAPQPPPGGGLAAGCIPPFRRDPVSGDCRIFLGSQVGPDPSPNGVGGGGGEVVSGAFGMPAAVPVVEMREHHSCPKAMVLGEDMLCYPKAVLRRNSKFRKWRPGMRPILTGGERRGITKARSSVNRAREAVGLAALKV